MTNELGERRDLKDEREHEEYEAMCEQVEAEMIATATECGFPGLAPDGMAVHAEALRRLRKKYESACGE